MAQQTDHIPDVGKKVTAVEFIRTELERLGMLDKGKVMTRIFEQAKAMEKEQIMDGFMYGKWDWSEHIKEGKESKDPAEYYNETYENSNTTTNR